MHARGKWVLTIIWFIGVFEHLEMFHELLEVAGEMFQQQTVVVLLLHQTNLTFKIKTVEKYQSCRPAPCPWSSWLAGPEQENDDRLFLFWFLIFENCKKMFIPPLRWHWCTDEQGQSKASSATFFIVKHLQCSVIYHHAMVRNISFKLQKCQKCKYCWKTPKKYCRLQQCLPELNGTTEIALFVWSLLPSITWKTNTQRHKGKSTWV